MSKAKSLSFQIRSKSRIAVKLLGGYLFPRGRRLPDFLIIGTQKGGTSSLFKYLLQHPQVEGSLIKEVHFFTRRYWLGERGYRAFFPSPEGKPAALLGEATPYYLFSPETPERAASLVPGARLVILLREPVSRAYSHYQHNVRKGYERRRFEEACEADLALFEKSGSLRKDPDESELNYRRFSYVRRGIYEDQIRQWLDHFPKENIHIGRAEDLFSDTSGTVSRIGEFLGLDPFSFRTEEAYNRISYDRKSRDAFPGLAAFYEEPNRRLLELTGISW